MGKLFTDIDIMCQLRSDRSSENATPYRPNVFAAKRADERGVSSDGGRRWARRGHARGWRGARPPPAQLATRRDTSGVTPKRIARTLRPVPHLAALRGET